MSAGTEKLQPAKQTEYGNGPRITAANVSAGKAQKLKPAFGSRIVAAKYAIIHNDHQTESQCNQRYRRNEKRKQF